MCYNGTCNCTKRYDMDTSTLLLTLDYIVGMILEGAQWGIIIWILVRLARREQ
jgi:hypothetical protein